MVGIDTRDRSGRGSVGARRVVTAVAAAAVAVMLVPGAALAATSPQGQNPASGPAAASETPTTRTGVIGTWGLDGEWGTNPVPSGDDFVEIDSAGFASAARRADGSMVAWEVGWDEEYGFVDGLLERGEVIAAWAAQQHDVVAVSIEEHVLALHSDGTVTSSLGQTTVPSDLSDVVQIAAGSEFSLALRSDGTVVAWDDNGNGRTDVPAGLTDVVDIAAGGGTALAVGSDGTVVGWGTDAWGTATPPAGLSDVVRVSTDGAVSVAIKSDGSVVAWGDDRWGQTSVPAGLTGIVDVEITSVGALALRDDGTVTSWGKPTAFWQAGYSYTGDNSVPIGLTDVIDIAAGGVYGLVVTAQQGGPLPDTTPPVITPPAPVITKAATSTQGARVYAAATTTDAAFGRATGISCQRGNGARFNMYDGPWFRPGKKVVNCSAYDWAGNDSRASYRVHIFYSWSGLQSPVNPEGTTVRDRRKNLPLTFTLTGSSSGIKGVKAKASYALVTNGETGPYTAAKATDRTGNTFVYKNGTYRFNWKTSGLKKGTYSLKVDLGDQKPHTILVKLT